jgi:hypothetical protein
MQIGCHSMVTTANLNHWDINGLATSRNRPCEACLEKCPLLGNVYHVEAIRVDTNVASSASV